MAGQSEGFATVASKLKNTRTVVQNILDLKLVAARAISQITFLDRRIDPSCPKGWVLQYVGARCTCTCVQDKSSWTVLATGIECTYILVGELLYLDTVGTVLLG